MSSIEPSRGRIEPAIAVRHCHLRRTSAPSVELLPPAILRSNRVCGELHRALLSLPDPFPLRFRRPRRKCAAAPPWPPRCAAGTRRGPPLRGPTPHRRTPRGRLASLSPAPPSSDADGTALPPRDAACRRRPAVTAGFRPRAALLAGRPPRPPRSLQARRRRAWPGQSKGAPPPSLSLFHAGWGPRRVVFVIFVYFG